MTTPTLALVATHTATAYRFQTTGPGFASWIQRGTGRRARILDFRAPGIAYVFRDARVWTSTRAEFLADFEEAA